MQNQWEIFTLRAKGAEFEGVLLSVCLTPWHFAWYLNAIQLLVGYFYRALLSLQVAASLP